MTTNELIEWRLFMLTRVLLLLFYAVQLHTKAMNGTQQRKR